MLLWAGIGLIALGVACLAIDRQAVHFFYDHIHASTHRLLDRVTHLAKAGHWLMAALVAYGATQTGMKFGFRGAVPHLISSCALAFLIALTAGSAVLHSMKFFLGRRRPRDEIEMNLYGFEPLNFDLQHNSFPSGHAMTIFCVAVVASAAFPSLAALWFVLALLLSLTRALLTAHFVSDVFIGAGIGVIAAREAIVLFFPKLILPWF